MLNNAFPSNMWNLYDYYLTENGALYSVRKALGKSHYFSNKTVDWVQLFHMIYDYDDTSIWLVINYQYKFSKISNNINITGVYNIRNINGVILDTKTINININNINYDSSIKIFDSIIKPNGVKLFFLQLLLIDNDNNIILDENIYWFGDKSDELDWKNSNFYETKVKKYADFKQLNTLNNIQLNINNNTIILQNGNYKTIYSIKNQSNNIIAFMININLMIHNNGKDELVKPVFWSDNWLTIFPQNQRMIYVIYNKNDLKQMKPFIIVNTYNNIV